MEVQRLGSIAPQAVPHRTLRPVTVQGHNLPADCLVFSMLHHIMRDPDYWPQPNRFSPQRFLGSF